MKSNGQFSVDYLIAVIMLGIVALVIFVAFDTNERQVAITTERIYMKGIAEGLANTIDSVLIIGDGAQKEFHVANTTLTGRHYNITIRKNLVLLRWNQSDYAARFATSKLNFTDMNSTEIWLQPGDIIIWNSNGTIYLQNPK